MNAPLEIVACEACGGAGYTVHFVMVYEHGCGFPHSDTEERRCRHCDGLGEFIREAEGRTEREQMADVSRETLLSDGKGEAK